MSRALVPRILTTSFFDDFFEDVNREALRQQYDMRNAMLRLAQRDPIANFDKGLDQQMKQLREPIVKKEDGSEALELQLDLSNYKPEEITVKTSGKDLSVHAKHEEKTDNSTVYQEFNRCFTLPDSVKPDAVQSTLSKDGILSITGPVDRSLEGPKKIPIEQ